MRIIIIIWSFVFTLTAFGQKEDENQNNKEARMKAEMALIDGQKYLILENYAKALEMFQTAEEIVTDDPAVHFKIAEVLFQSNYPDKAISSARRAIDLDPSNKFYYVLAADIEKARGDLGASQKLYEELLALGGNEGYLSELALLYEYQGKYKKAIETLEKLKGHFGTNEAIVREFQKIYDLIGTPEKALSEWEELARDNPSEDQYLFGYINQLMSLEKSEAAKTYLKEFLNNDPENAQAKLLMAEILKNEGNSSDAILLAEASLLSPSVDFSLKAQILSDLLGSSESGSSDQLANLTKKVAQIHSDDYVAQALTGDILFQLGKRKESINYYLAATAIKADNFSVWQNILSLEAEFQMWAPLTEHAEKAIEYFPNQGAIYHFAGTGHLRLANYQRATQYFEMGKRFAINDVLKSAFEAQLGDAYKGMKSYAKSDQAFENAIKLNPKNDHALNNYSYSLALRKTKLERALSLSSDLVELQPNNANYLDTRGTVLFAAGEFKEAKKVLARAVEDTQNPNILEHYGDVLFKLGQEKDALSAWEKSLELGNQSQLIQKKIADRKYYE